MLRFPWQHA
jgi:activating signal cointegrator complex subunit 3